MKNFDKIEQYIKGKLSQEEKSEFEKELKQDKVLADEYESQLLEEEFIEFMVREQVSHKVRQVKNSLDHKADGEKTPFF